MLPTTGDRHRPPDADGAYMGAWNNDNYALASDVLEGQFDGPCTLNVLSQLEVPDEEGLGRNKVVRLVEIKAPSGQVVELALTKFKVVTWEELGTELAVTHQKVMNGAPMGKTFREHGIPFVRRVRVVNQRLLPDSFCAYFNTALPATVLILDVYIGEEGLHYAQIMEVYTNEVNWPDAPSPSTAEIDRAIEELNGLLISLPNQ